MYKIFGVVTLLFLAACSPKNNQEIKTQENIEALAQFTDISTDSPDFGNPVTASTTRIFKFKNEGDMAGAATPTLSGANAASFAITLQTGCASVNVGATCTVRVNFNPSGKAPASYVADLTVGGSTVKSLIAVVGAASTGGTTSGGSGGIEASVSGAVVSNPLDYGSFSGTQTSTKIIRLTNKSTSSVGPHTAALSDGDFTFTLNSCSNKTLAPNAYCDVRVTFNASSKTAQDYLTDLTFAGSTFPLKATVAASTTGGSTTGGTSGGSGAIEASIAGVVVTPPIDYLTLSGTQSTTKIIRLKNISSASVGPHSATLTNPAYTFTLNGCNNKTLAPNAYCDVRVTLSASGKAPNTYNGDLVFGSSTTALTGIIQGAGTTTGGTTSPVPEVVEFIESLVTKTSLEYGEITAPAGVVTKIITIKNAGTATLSSRSAQLSNSDYTFTLNGCSNKSLAPGAMCTVRVSLAASGKTNNTYTANLTFGTPALSLSGSINVALVCSTGTHLDVGTNTCVSNTRSCEILPDNAATGVENWNSTTSTWGACQIATCNSGFEKLSNQCLADCQASEHRNTTTLACDANEVDCTLESLHATAAIKTWTGSTYGACIASSCETHYEVTAGSCSLQNYALNLTKSQGGVVTNGGSGIAQLFCLANDTSCSAQVPALSSQTLQATAEPGYEFVTWGGDCGSFGTSPTCTISMDASKTVDAQFQLVAEPTIIGLEIRDINNQPFDLTSQPIENVSIKVYALYNNNTTQLVNVADTSINASYSGINYYQALGLNFSSDDNLDTFSFYSAGTYQITAFHAGFYAYANVTINPAAPHHFIEVSGNNQTGLQVGAQTNNMHLRLVDLYDNYIPDTIVDIQTNPNYGDPLQVTTSQYGIIDYAPILPTYPGIQEYRFMVPNSTSYESFLVDVLVGNASQIVYVSGNNQSATVDTVLSAPLKVQILDQYNNPVQYASPSFISYGGGGSVESQSPYSDENGYFEANIRMPTTAGPVLFKALHIGIGVVDFDLTATPDVITQLVFTTQPAGGVETNQNLSVQPVVESRDQFNNITTNDSSSLTYEASNLSTCASVEAGIISGGAALNQGIASSTNIQFSQQGDYYIKVSLGAISICSNQVQIIQGAETDPQVVSILPAAGGQVSTTVATEFTVNFDRPMNVATYLPANVYMNGGTLTLDLINSTDTQLKFSVPSGLTNNQSYNIFLTSGIQDTNGRSLQPYNFNVYTGNPGFSFSPRTIAYNLVNPQIQDYYKTEHFEFVSYGPVGNRRWAYSLDGGETYVDEEVPASMQEHYFLQKHPAFLNNKHAFLNYYYDNSTNTTTMKVAYFDGSSWINVPIPNQTQASYASDASVAIDGTNTIVVSYTLSNEVPSLIRVLKYTISSNTWNTEQTVSYTSDIIPHSPQFNKVIYNGNNKFSIIFAQPEITGVYLDLYARVFDASTNNLASIISLENSSDSVAIVDLSVSVNSTGKALVAWRAQNITTGQQSLRLNRYDGTNWRTMQTVISADASMHNLITAVSDNNSAILAFAQSIGGDTSYSSGQAYRIADITVAGTTVALGTKTNITDFTESFIYAGTTYQSTDETYNPQGPFGFQNNGTWVTSGTPKVVMSPTGEALVTWHGPVSYANTAGYGNNVRRMFNRYIPGTGWAGAKAVHFEPYVSFYDSLSYKNGKFKISDLSQNLSEGNQWSHLISVLETPTGTIRPIRYVGGYDIDNKDKNYYFVAFSKTNSTTSPNIGKGVMLFKKADYLNDATIYATTSLKSTDTWSTALTTVIPPEDNAHYSVISYASNDRGDVAVAWRAYDGADPQAPYVIKMRRYFNTGTGTGTWSSIKTVTTATNGGQGYAPKVAIDNTGKVFVVYNQSEVINDVTVYAIRGRTYNNDASATVIETSPQLVHYTEDPQIVRYSEFELASKNGRTFFLHNTHETHRRIGEVGSSFNVPITYESYATLDNPILAPVILSSSSRVAVVYIAPRTDVNNNTYNALFMVYKDGSGNFSAPIRIDNNIYNVYYYKAFMKTNGDIEIIYADEDYISKLKSVSFTNSLSSTVDIPKIYVGQNPSIWDADMSSDGTLLVMWLNQLAINAYNKGNILYNIKQPGLSWSRANYLVQIPDYNQHGTNQNSDYSDYIFARIDDFDRILGVFNSPSLPELNPGQIYSRSLNY